MPRFETARTRQLRAKQLGKLHTNILGDIEESGCGVVHVAAPECSLGWSYTVGAHDSLGTPEFVAVGLPFKTAQFALNEAVRLAKQGVDLTAGKRPEFLNSADCLFRPVHPAWIAHILYAIDWCYDGHALPPVLQIIYPDLENRFQHEAGFDAKFEQPLLQSEEPSSPLGIQFWRHQLRDTHSTWPFPDKRHTQVLVSNAVHSGTEPVTWVYRGNDDGDWQFQGDSEGESGAVAVCLHHPIDQDASLLEIADLPRGWIAARDFVGDPWVRRPMPDDDHKADESL